MNGSAEPVAPVHRTRGSGAAPARIAVLASGAGTNLAALFDHLERRGAARAGDVVLVASDKADAGALTRAQRHGIEAAVIRDPGDASALLAMVQERDVDLIALAGYMRYVPDEVTRVYRGRLLNVHPALLPAFGGRGMYGERVHAAVLASGARLSGVSVHFVDEQYDHGPIAAQWPVPVLAEDTPATLGARVLAVEHVLYPRVVNAVAGGRIVLGADGRVGGAFLTGGLEANRASFAWATDDGSLERDIDAALGS